MLLFPADDADDVDDVPLNSKSSFFPWLFCVFSLSGRTTTTTSRSRVVVEVCWTSCTSSRFGRSSSLMMMMIMMSFFLAELSVLCCGDVHDEAGVSGGAEVDSSLFSFLSTRM